MSDFVFVDAIKKKYYTFVIIKSFLLAYSTNYDGRMSRVLRKKSKD